jgi:hypothetical protein
VGSAVLCGIVAFWIHGIVDFNYGESNRMWFFIGTGTALMLMDKTLKAPENSLVHDGGNLKH